MVGSKVFNQSRTTPRATRSMVSLCARRRGVLLASFKRINNALWRRKLGTTSAFGEIEKPVAISYGSLRETVSRALMKHGASEFVALSIADELCKAEKDGAKDHGVRRLEIFCSMLATGTAAGTAEPIVEETTDTIIKADGGGGFAQPCLHLAIPQLIDTAWENGICILTISNCRGILGTLWSPLEQISSTGLIAVGLCNTPAYVAWPGSRKRLLGTNPLGFGWPRRGKPPMVFDQASSVMSRGAMERLASVVGEQQPLPPKAAVDELGRHVQDPSKGLSGAMLPFGGQKGANVALMVELLSLLAGGNMAFETVKAPGAEGEETDTVSSPTATKGGGVEADLASMDRGMVFLALSPEFFPGGMTASARAELLFEHMRSGEGKIEDVKVKSTLDMDTYDEQNDFVHSIPRLPGDKRYENRASIEAGEPIFLCPELYETLTSLGSQEGDM